MASKTKQPEEDAAASAEATDLNQVRALQPRGSIDHVEAGTRDPRLRIARRLEFPRQPAVIASGADFCGTNAILRVCRGAGPEA